MFPEYAYSSEHAGTIIGPPLIKKGSNTTSDGSFIFVLATSTLNELQSLHETFDSLRLFLESIIYLSLIALLIYFSRIFTSVMSLLNDANEELY